MFYKNILTIDAYAGHHMTSRLRELQLQSFHCVENVEEYNEHK